jgi:hypothetical protein
LLCASAGELNAAVAAAVVAPMRAVFLINFLRYILISPYYFYLLRHGVVIKSIFKRKERIGQLF